VRLTTSSALRQQPPKRAAAGGSLRASTDGRFAVVAALGGPAAVAIGAFVLLPLVIVSVLSVFTYDPLERSLQFAGLANFQRILTSDQFRQAFVNTIVYMALTVPVSVGLGLLIASGIHHVSRFGSFWRTAYFLPAVTTMAAMSAVWRWMFHPDSGMVDSTVGGLVGVHDWLNSATWVLPAMALIGNWQELGTMVILFLAGLTAVPERVIEAARVDGAGVLSRFRHVTVPALRPALLFAVVVATRDSLRAFDQIKVMTDGGPVGRTTTLAYYEWLRGVRFLDIGGGSVVNLILVALVLVLAAIQLPGYWRRAAEGTPA
jgi:multiple sugar transport system permease protein